MKHPQPAAPALSHEATRGDLVANVLLRTLPQRIIYVSCNPATLARDLRRMSPGFHAGEIRCFDLFPQTAHVETVAELVRTS